MHYYNIIKSFNEFDSFVKVLSLDLDYSENNNYKWQVT